MDPLTQGGGSPLLANLVSDQLLADNPGGRIEGEAGLDAGQLDLLHG
jgi:hypothetical protein